MGSEQVRLLLCAVLWAASGALACAAYAADTRGACTRMGAGAALLALCGLWSAWPLARPRTVPQPLQEPAPPVDTKRLAILEAQLEHLPVAAWALANDRLQPLSNRARRLVAPGGVRDKDALRALLLAASASGPVVLETERGSERWQLRRQSLALEGTQHALLVLMPLENELESESLQAWQQLVQVLTHEIMNSLTPIKSLSQTALTLLDEPGTVAEVPDLQDLRLALNAIRHRADGLASFVSTYRQVSQWPAPVMVPVDLQELFQRLERVAAPDWAARGGVAKFEVSSPGLRLQADGAQLEQALLALLTNAAQATALHAAPKLWVQARTGRGGRLLISVRDNGPGVPVGMERQIFLPFFSAREGGQGIGLTVVRQLVHGMGGRVRHVRPLEGGAAFILSF